MLTVFDDMGVHDDGLNALSLDPNQYPTLVSSIALGMAQRFCTQTGSLMDVPADHVDVKAEDAPLADRGIEFMKAKTSTDARLAPVNWMMKYVGTKGAKPCFVMEVPNAIPHVPEYPLLLLMLNCARRDAFVEITRFAYKFDCRPSFSITGAQGSGGIVLFPSDMSPFFYSQGMEEDAGSIRSAFLKMSTDERRKTVESHLSAFRENLLDLGCVLVRGDVIPPLAEFPEIPTFQIAPVPPGMSIGDKTEFLKQLDVTDEINKFENKTWSHVMMADFFNASGLDVDVTIGLESYGSKMSTELDRLQAFLHDNGRGVSYIGRTSADGKAAFLLTGDDGRDLRIPGMSKL